MKTLKKTQFYYAGMSHTYVVINIYIFLIIQRNLIKFLIQIRILNVKILIAHFTE